VPVDGIRVGQRLLSYDTQTGSVIAATGTSVNKNSAIKVDQIVDINNGLLYASGLPTKPIYVQLQNGTREWVELGQLQVGMKLFQPTSANWITVTNIQDLRGSFTVYDLRAVNGRISSYVANGVLLNSKTYFNIWSCSERQREKIPLVLMVGSQR